MSDHHSAPDAFDEVAGFPETISETDEYAELLSLNSSSAARYIPDGFEKGTFFNTELDLRAPEGDAFTATLLDEMTPFERPRRRRRKLADEVNRSTRVRKLAANGLRCEWHRETPLVSYMRGAEWYLKPEVKLDKPEWFAADGMVRDISSMEKAGLLVSTVSHRKQIASSYVVTDKLLRIADECGVTVDSLCRRVPRNRLVILNGPKPRPFFDVRQGKLIRRKAESILFEPTAQTGTWTNDLAANNEFMMQQNITVPVSPELEAIWTAHLNRKESLAGADFRRPELIQTDVYRVFNNGSAENPLFDQGGRMAGAWWMNVPKEVRSHILINGKPTVELDYSACHPNMLYHERGLECVGDPYEIERVADYCESSGKPLDTYRPYFKWLMQVMINGRGRPDLADAPDCVAFPFASIRDHVMYLEHRHKPIADNFGTRAGLRLMRKESDIALAIVTKAREQGWVVLPIHDSFIAALENKEHLRALMIEACLIHFPIKPIIK